MNKFLVYILLSLIFLQACKKEDKMPPINEAVDLDGMLINDSSLANPAGFLLSAAAQQMPQVDKNKAVVIAVHGFTATTFEWLEFSEFAENNDFYVSRILLGGHGRNYETFKNSTWENWQEPMIAEYNLLRSMGFTNISLAAVSTGCPVILDAVSEGKLNPDVLKNIYLIDPIIIPSNKSLSLIPVAGSLLGYSEAFPAEGENGFWYKYRPYQALQQLNDLTKKLRKDLEKGIKLPAGVNLWVFKSNQDDAADPLSAVLINKGIKKSNGENINVIVFESDLHVITRLRGRGSFTARDIEIQQEVFKGIKQTL
jgi:carboxylesterase